MQPGTSKDPAAQLPLWRAWALGLAPPGFQSLLRSEHQEDLYGLLLFRLSHGEGGSSHWNRAPISRSKPHRTGPSTPFFSRNK